ncbi:glycosyltransferase family 9 protein [Bacteroidota bacterium]
MIKPKNILIVRTDRIGDVILSLPLARIIKNKYPDCKITFLVRNYTAAIVLGHPYIDEVIILREADDTIPINVNVDLLKDKKYDTGIIVYPTFKTALIVYLSGIKTRIGSGYRWYSVLFNNKVFEHRKTAEKHELEYNISLLKKIKIDEQPLQGNVNFDLKVNSEALEYVNRISLDYWIDLDKKLVVVHPGSGGSAVDLPTEKMSKIVQDLAAIEDVNIIVTGSDSEFSLCESITSGTNAINLAGKFDLQQITALISLSHVFVSNSTGPIHIAAALGIPVIGFYPKIRACSEERWGPYTTKKVIFSPETDCSNCNREQCERLNCMNTIDIHKVTDEVKNQILRTTKDLK